MLNPDKKFVYFHCQTTGPVKYIQLLHLKGELVEIFTTSLEVENFKIEILKTVRKMQKLNFFKFLYFRPTETVDVHGLFSLFFF